MYFFKYIEVLELVCEVLHILKLRQFIVSINWYWTVSVKFFTFTSVFCLREYWPVVDQEDTVLSGVTLNFLDCVSVFAFFGKNISNGHFMAQGHFQMRFHPSFGHVFYEN